MRNGDEPTLAEQNRPTWDEAERLAALRRYGILDTPPEVEFDDVVRIAAHVCGAPISVVNLIDDQRQWFKAETGLGVRETPLDVSICAQAILQLGLFVVPDTTKDPRFNCNPLVTGEPHLRFYAGALLETPERLPLGTVCVLDYKPRELTDEQAFTLQALARQVMAHLELRRTVEEAQRRAAEAQRYAEQLQALARAAVRVTEAEALEVTIQEIADTAREIVGTHQSIVSLARGPDWNQALSSVSLPDKYKAFQSFAKPPDGLGIDTLVCETNGPIRLTQAELETNPRWNSFSPKGRNHPPVGGWLAAPLIAKNGQKLGLVQLSDKKDGTEFGEGDEAVLVQLAQLAAAAVEHAATEAKRHEAEERQRLLIRELHHRVRNTLATVQSILGTTARTSRTVEEFYRAFSGRIESLARTHMLLTEDLWQVTTLREILETELQPYRNTGIERIRLEGPDVELASEVAVPLGMAIHELTTNAARFGALSVWGGRLDVVWRVMRAEQVVLHLEWTERGGPVVKAPEEEGFGSRVIHRVLAAQADAKVTMDFDPSGLRVVIHVPLRAPDKAGSGP
ncbi:HWE histidine kinase domain-containing protein [Microvirga roseola]|uniref:HWE histidine kinase domain-containing protein n=1 Tax=Microvirga roseola TaxID=2883126 RepID=UPI001E5B73A9|nr:HWE histidine kinase domain-containing protein [Microvirga roseola]